MVDLSYVYNAIHLSLKNVRLKHFLFCVLEAGTYFDWGALDIVRSISEPVALKEPVNDENP